MRRLLSSLSTVVLTPFILVLFSIPAHGQTFDNTNAFLELSPNNTTPNTLINVRLNAYSLNLSGTTIVWTIDGEEIADARDKLETSVFLGDLGSSMVVAASIRKAGQAPVVVSRKISAVSVDIVVEPNTSKPSFYKGRSLPAADETVRVVAVPHTGNIANPESYTYTWRLGQIVLGGGGRKGLMSTEFTMPRRDTLLSVSITDTNGTYVGGKSISLSPNNPEVLFYEENPLRGIKQNAIGNTLVSTTDETIIHAGIYNLSKDIFSKNPQLRWVIDGEETQNYEDNGASIALRGGGSAPISFRLINPNSLTQFVQGSFTIFFNTP